MYKTTYCLILYLESYNDCLKSIVNFLTTLFLSSKAGNKSFNNFCLLIISSNFSIINFKFFKLNTLISIFDFDFPFVVADVINSIKIGINSVIFFLVNNDEFVLMVAMVSFSFYFSFSSYFKIIFNIINDANKFEFELASIGILINEYNVIGRISDN